jgi:hypothetical protein
MHWRASSRDRVAHASRIPRYMVKPRGTSYSINLRLSPGTESVTEIAVNKKNVWGLPDAQFVKSRGVNASPDSFGRRPDGEIGSVIVLHQAAFRCCLSPERDGCRAQVSRVSAESRFDVTNYSISASRGSHYSLRSHKYPDLSCEKRDVCGIRSHSGSGPFSSAQAN